MARGVNKVILVGNLGADPETRAMPSGSTVANLRIATSESWRDKTSGEQQERTEWHRVALFGRLAEIASEYLKKGSQVYIEGSLRTRKWQDKQGNERFSTEIVGNELQMLGGRGGAGGGGGGGGSGPSYGGGGGGAPPGVGAAKVVAAVEAAVRLPSRIPSTPVLQAPAVKRTISTTTFRFDEPQRGLDRTPDRAWAGPYPLILLKKISLASTPGGDGRAIRRVRP